MTRLKPRVRGALVFADIALVTHLSNVFVSFVVRQSLDRITQPTFRCCSFRSRLCSFLRVSSRWRLIPEFTGFE